ncbi:hypothetical protein BDFG_04569 [Blastomyces dermatitidis ATCC 26199]|nr:hypothetical protein BDFG_04569 [Blastomyces dermatitidis ATCC 26199]
MNTVSYIPNIKLCPGENIWYLSFPPLRSQPASTPYPVTGSNQYHCGTKLHKSDGNKHLRTNPKPPQEKQANFNIPINFPPHFGGLPYQIVGRRIPRCFIFLKPCLLGIRKKGGKAISREF